MSEILLRVLAGLAGAALGAFFFGGLWWTIRRGLPSSQPAFWFLGSMLLRTGVTLAGFYFVSGSHWPRLLICLIAFGLMRPVVTWFTRPPATRSTNPKPEVVHAP